jgi:hypothetical protein
MFRRRNADELITQTQAAATLSDGGTAQRNAGGSSGPGGGRRPAAVTAQAHATRAPSAPTTVERTPGNSGREQATRATSAKPLLCRTRLHHHWTLEIDPDSHSRLRCTRCKRTRRTNVFGRGTFPRYDSPRSRSSSW